jgi:hypothetical protein
MTPPPDGRDEQGDAEALAEPGTATDPEALSEPGGSADVEALAEPATATEPETLAPLGGPAEPEPPHHTVDPGAASDDPVEDSVAYELAVEDGAPLAPQGLDPGAGDGAPEFRAPGEG